MSDRGPKNGRPTLALAMSGLLYAHTAAQAAPPASGNPENRQLDQKRVLVERLLFHSPLGKQATVDAYLIDPDAYRQWESARRAYDQALIAMKTDNSEHADQALDMALSLYQSASKQNRKASEPPPEQQRLYTEIRDRVQGYRESYQRIVAEKGERADPDTGSKALEQAEKLHQAGDTTKALKVLMGAQSELERALIEARSGETLVTRMEFDSPEEALNYEIEKLAGNERLLATLTQAETLNEGKRRLVTQYLEQSRTASALARNHLDAGRLDEATRATEAAAAAQTRALRLFGVNM